MGQQGNSVALTVVSLKDGTTSAEHKSAQYFMIVRPLTAAEIADVNLTAGSAVTAIHMLDRIPGRWNPQVIYVADTAAVVHAACETTIEVTMVTPSITAATTWYFADMFMSNNTRADGTGSIIEFDQGGFDFLGYGEIKVTQNPAALAVLRATLKNTAGLPANIILTDSEAIGDLNIVDDTIGIRFADANSSIRTNGAGLLDVNATTELGLQVGGADVANLATGLVTVTGGIAGTVADTVNQPAALFTQNDTTNNPNVLVLANSGGGFFINTSGSSSIFSVKSDGEVRTQDLTVQGRISLAAGTSSTGPAAVAATTTLHKITTTGTGDAMTLANGLETQFLRVLYIAEGAGSDTAILTPTNLAGADTTITFNAVGDSADMLFTSGTWFYLGGKAIAA